MLWLRDRTVPEVVRDAHSIWLETAAELGLVGLALLAALVGGVALAAVRARRGGAAAVAGPAAALAVVGRAQRARLGLGDARRRDAHRGRARGLLLALADAPGGGGSPRR